MVAPAVAAKLSAARVVVVAGPPAVGKTTLLRSIRRGTPHAALPDELQALLARRGAVMNCRDLVLPMEADTYLSQLFVHLDISQFAIPRKARLPRLAEVLRDAQEVHVLTLWAPPDVLASRLDHRRLVRSADCVPADNDGRATSRDELKRHLLVNPDAVDALYRAWFRFADAFSIRSSWVIDSTDQELTAGTDNPWSMTAATTDTSPCAASPAAPPFDETASRRP